MRHVERQRVEPLEDSALVPNTEVKCGGGVPIGWWRPGFVPCEPLGMNRAVPGKPASEPVGRHMTAEAEREE